MNQKCSLLVSSCDKYEDMWVPFFTQLKENWKNFDMRVLLSTEHKTFSFPDLAISCPLSNHKKIENSWSKRLELVLDKIETEYVLFMLDDFWLLSPVNTTIFDNCISYMEKDPGIGFICLIPQKAGNEETSYKELYRRAAKTPFRITTQAGLWRKDYFKKILRSHESAWFFETRASWRSDHLYRESVYAVRPEYSVFRYPEGGVVWGGKFIRDYIKDYAPEIQAMCCYRDYLVGPIGEYPPLNKCTWSYLYGGLRSIMPKF